MRSVTLAIWRFDMNKHTKKSLIFSILALAVIAAGLLVFILAADSIADSTSKPVDDENGLAAIGKILAIFAGAIAIILIGICDAVFTSLFVYMFAYFSHQHAKIAIEACSDESTTAKALRVIAVIEMVIAAIVAIIGGLLIILLFSFM